MSMAHTFTIKSHVRLEKTHCHGALIFLSPFLYRMNDD